MCGSLLGRGGLAMAFLPAAFAADVYFNDFNGPRGAIYPEWTSSGYTNTANAAGTVPSGSGPQVVTNVDSANGKQRFLGEFGGPTIVATPPYDLQHFVRVNETVTLKLTNLKPHSLATVSFDLYILKSWDGNNPNYGPDRWSLSVGGGATLLDTTFSNNFKTGAYDLSQQNYPTANSLPQTAAVAVNSLGYTFYGDAIYHLTFTFPHAADTLVLNFASSLCEGKGTDDESWGLDNVRVSTNQDHFVAVSATAPGVGLAPGSLGSIYGADLGAVTQSADGQPLPTHLGNVSLNILDSGGVSRLAPLSYVSPGQINFEVPAGTQTGPATFTILSDSGNALSATGSVQALAPGLFTANEDGRGVAAATALRIVPGSNLQVPVDVFHCGSAPGSCASVPIDVGVEAPVYLSLYGSGIRGATLADVAVNIGGKLVPVLYVGRQADYEGLDQVNVNLPLSLRGLGEVELVVGVTSQSSNPVRINIR
jgi:uncharacterized protein (TIGR03437 family)